MKKRLHPRIVRIVDHRLPEIEVDNFAGGGGASTGIEAATGRSVAIAINHDPIALAIHKANHVGATHYVEDVWEVDPVVACRQRPVGLAWFSPDCVHHSKARGGKPRSQGIRGLAMVLLRWAALVRPRIMCLENVEEFQQWGPLDKEGHPIKAQKGRTFRSFVKQIRDLGYVVEWKELVAADFGAPTTRQRLFLVARCDGRPIAWPTPTHGNAKKWRSPTGKIRAADPEVLAGRRPVWKSAASIIDWSIPCPSIFERKKPLADATCRRIATGLMKYVVTAAKPFIIRTGYGERRDTSKCKGQEPRVLDIHAPLGTVVAQGQKHGLVAAFLAKHNGGGEEGHQTPGPSVEEPMPTITGTGQMGPVAVYLTRQFGTSNAADINDPIATIMPDGGGKTQLVAAFMATYYRTGTLTPASLPTPTITGTDRLALVTLTIDGTEYVVVDIGMRMLQPHELALAQGFPPGYNFSPIINGKKMPKSRIVKAIGNSVVPQLAEALVSANYYRRVPEQFAAVGK